MRATHNQEHEKNVDALQTRVLERLAEDFEVLGDEASGYAFLPLSAEPIPQGYAFFAAGTLQLEWESHTARDAGFMLHGDAGFGLHDFTGMYAQSFDAFIADGVKHYFECWDFADEWSCWTLDVRWPQSDEQAWAMMMAHCAPEQDWDLCVPRHMRCHIKRMAILLNTGNARAYLIDTGEAFKTFFFVTS